MKWQSRWVGLVILVFWGYVGGSWAGEIRTWTDQSGKFRVEAEFVSQDGSKVRLLMKNGKKTSLPIQKLSDEDRAYLERMEENPFLAGVEDEEEEAEPEKGSKASSKKSRKVPQVGVPCGDTSGEKAILVGGESVPWSVQPKATPLSKAKKSPCLIPVRKSAIFAKVNMFTDEALWVGGPESDTVVFTFSTGHFNEDRTYVERCRLAGGDAQLCPLPVRGKVTDLSPDGKSLLCIRETPKVDSMAGFRDKFTLTRLAFKGNRLVTTAEFRPYYPKEPVAEPAFLRADIDSAWFVDDDHVLTSSGSMTTLWDCTRFRSVYSLNISGRQITLSPDREWMVLATSKQLEFRKTRDGKLCGTISLEDEKVKHCAFDPTGTRLAVLGAADLRVYDLTDARTLYEIPVVASPTVGKLLWTGEKTLLVGAVLFDLESGVPLFDYCFRPRTPLAYGHGLVWTVLRTGFREKRVDQVLGLTLPHTQAVEAMKKIDLPTQFALYPGAKVKLTIETNGFADEKEIRDKLTERFTERKITFSDDAPVEVILRYADTGKEEEVSYAQARSRYGFAVPRPSRGRFREQPLGTMKLKVYEQSLEIVENGKTLWKNTFQAIAPNRVKYDPKKTIEDTFREVNKPNPNYVNFVPVPGYVSRDQKGSQALYRGIIQPDGSVR
ncbi:MAG: SHD1 domain-containing protein [Planctomycetia bacterium]|nr:SHD1 domain-containing protein [Planctomycetia bacterium]